MKRRNGSRTGERVAHHGDATDAEAFARAMTDVVPLKPDPRGRVRSRPTASHALHTTPFHDADDEASTEFLAAGVDRREIRKLKRGEYAVRDRRDLHGITVAAASDSVRWFIENSRHRGYRCICIVHGRGSHSEGGTSVLKTRVREWLRSNAAVLAYTDAPPSDGGAGAVYVLLRK